MLLQCRLLVSLSQVEAGVHCWCMERVSDLRSRSWCTTWITRSPSTSTSPSVSLHRMWLYILGTMVKPIEIVWNWQIDSGESHSWASLRPLWLFYEWAERLRIPTRSLLPACSLIGPFTSLPNRNAVMSHLRPTCCLRTTPSSSSPFSIHLSQEYGSVPHC